MDKLTDDVSQGSMSHRPRAVGAVVGIGAAMAVSFVVATPVMAQTAATSSSAAAEEDLGEIVVTARRVEERSQDVPISIQVFNQEQLTEHNVSSGADLALYTPSLSANTNFGTANTTFAIRGFVQDSGTAPSVGVYFADVVAPRGNGNGIPVGDGASPGYFFDMQNVQILKGPQGTLFGRNTTGGAVLFVPQKPTSELGGYIEASYGNLDMRRVEAAVNVPLNDSIRLRLAVDDQRRDGYLNSYTGIGPDNYADVNYTAVRASLVADITANLENYTIVSFTRSDTNGDVQKIVGCDLLSAPTGALACGQLATEKAFGAKWNTVASDSPGAESLLENAQIINTTSWTASDALTVKNIASYAYLRDRLDTPLFGQNFPAFGAGQPPFIFSSVASAPGKWTSNESTITEELRAQGDVLDNRLTYQGGAYLEASNPLSYGGNQSPVFASCASPAALKCTDPIGIGATEFYGFPIQAAAVNYTVGETRYRDYGVYEQATYALTSQLKLTEGLRYTWDQESNSSQLITYHFPVTPPFTQGPNEVCTYALTSTLPGCFQFAEEQSRAPTWLIGLDYKPTDDVLIYAKYARGYRAGGVFANSPSNYRTWQPEKVDAYETGFKTTFTGVVRGTFDVAAFYNDFRNQQLQVGFDAAPGAAVSPTTGIANAGKSHIYGAEVSSSLEPVTGLVFSLDYTYLRTEITAIDPLVSSDPHYVLGESIVAGDPLVLSPRNKISISGAYTLPLSQSIGRIIVGTTFTHTDRQLANYDYLNEPNIIADNGGNFGQLGNRDLLDLNATWQSILGSALDLSLFGTNVTNQHYYTFYAGLGGAGPGGVPQVGFETGEVGAPRMYGLRLRYHFGNGK
jgi:iron complex outermembrane receptor protein